MCRLVFLELIPGFGLYRGLYEIAQYAFRAVYQASGAGCRCLAEGRTAHQEPHCILLRPWNSPVPSPKRYPSALAA